MDHGRRLGAERRSVQSKSQKSTPSGSGHAALAFGVFADVVLDGVKHAVAVFALDVELVMFCARWAL